MTYNFDPEGWYERERAALDRRRGAGDLSEEEAATALADLECRYQAMVDRLDGTYQLP